MKATFVLAMLLAALAPPARHGARRPDTICCRYHLRPPRVLRTPQAPKSVRKVD